ncbi:similar to Saccharomyces cerevisiae YLR047C FRE8 Protein with sequence similarity to iron/copper reductases, involved in iron homeostasis [Maudiozyma saulgeensis]|uniref:Similar to Saccharomyces cerevisiae YLR047C FRE8 Protein with sequence similarity to iron/copper reductases, involved in iron homeostasis n=1 Tax=Maudiozyma saulgeensis TaxID=1789683 RepID=A0A1X7R537_9SACH|nr:similar to Saccharomyces cerevisiae YLR047C FRE8 Protein with sequence similarity to iron/copper reductases, involved in iron homeostasis [Kazachstania saulgeensis]
MRNISDIIQFWSTPRMPSFDNNVDKETRTKLVNKYAKLCFLFSVTLVCIMIPLWYSLSVTFTFFKIEHRFKHHIFKPGTWYHRLPLYHNTSLRHCIFWCIVCTVAVFHHTSYDLLQITKRLGRVAVALMPPLLFVTLRPSPLPQTLYLRILPIHKWISRVVVLASLLHSIFYAYFMVIKGVFWIKIKKLPNVYGVIAMVLFFIIGITSIRKFRRINFRLFYYIHYISTWLTVILIHFHARPGVPYYTAMNCAILLYQCGYRIIHTKMTKMIVTPISPTLSLLEFPMTDLVKKPVLPSGHVRISRYDSNFIKRMLFQLVPFQHPYTIASLPDEDTVRLIIRNGQFKLKNGGSYYVTGAFEPIINFLERPKNVKQFLDNQKKRINPFQVTSLGLIHSPLHYVVNARRVLICVGGSAIAFGLPLLRVLNFNGIIVRLIWVIRDFRDLKLLEFFRNNFEGMEIYVSGDFGSEQDIQLNYDDRRTETANEPSLISGNNENFSLLASSNNKTYGTTRSDYVNEPEDHQEVDEIDFTNSFRIKKNRSRSQLRLDNKLSESQQRYASGNVFRKDVLLNPTAYNNNGCNHDGDCNDDHDNDDEATPHLMEEDERIKIPSGVKIYCGRPNLDERDYAWCLEQDCDTSIDDDECCQNRFDGSLSANVEKLSQVWVVAAGPDGLVESTRHWATDGGLHFHAESFAV